MRLNPDAVVKVMSQGRIVIPQPMREALHLKEGDYVKLKLRADSLFIVPVKMVEMGEK